MLGLYVSTHAPLAGSDLRSWGFLRIRACFNPRSPCGERPSGARRLTRSPGFQPTLPLRGATWASWLSFATCAVSTHAPLAGSDGAARGGGPSSTSVSTHAPLAGSDRSAQVVALGVPQVSTHAPLAGSDEDICCEMCDESVFQPTLPLRGATATGRPPRTPRYRFNPRSPCGERLAAHLGRPIGRGVSTHAPLAGSDDGELWSFRV